MGMFLMTLLLLTGVFLMIVVLLQRGRGGGLAGAFGGAGGQSVLGVKAGDVFTKITVGISVAWVILAGVSGLVLRSEADQYDADIVKGTEMVGSDSDDDSAAAGEGEAADDTEDGTGSGLVIPDAPEGGTEALDDSIPSLKSADDTPPPPSKSEEPPADETTSGDTRSDETESDETKADGTKSDEAETSEQEPQS